MIEIENTYYILRTQLCPKKGTTPTILFDRDGIKLRASILIGTGFWIVKEILAEHKSVTGIIIVTIPKWHDYTVQGRPRKL